MLQRLLFAVLLLSGGACFAQAGFRPGYVLPLAGDTVRGAVDYRGEQRGARLCRFRPAEGAAVVEYQPEQLRGYGFQSGRHYVSRQLKPAAAPVFVQALFLGRASLYRFTTAKGKELYYAQAAAEAHPRVLAQRDSLDTFYNKTQQRTMTMHTRGYPFRATLQFVMADCAAVQPTVAAIELKEAPLLALFRAYSTCTGSVPQYATPNPPARARFVLLAGAHQASLTLTDNGKQHFTTSAPTVGVGLDFIPNRFNSQLSLQVQVLYAQHNFDKQYVTKGYGVFANDDVKRDVYFHLKSLCVATLVRYTFSRGAVQPYLQAGGMLLGNMQRAARDVTFVPRFTNSERTNPVALHRFDAAAVVGAGVLVPLGRGSILLEARAEQTNPVTAGAVSGIRTLGLLAGYTFGR